MAQSHCSPSLWSALILSAMLGLAGCAIDELSAEQRQRARTTLDHLGETRDRFVQRAVRSKGRASLARIAKPWVAGRAITLAPEVTVPAALRANVQTTLLFKNKQATLPELANRLSIATGIPVRVLPDARLPAHLFMPRLGGTDTAVALPPIITPRMPMGTRPLSQVLELVAADHDVQWRYTGKAIEFFRTQTRVFDVRALTLPASAEMRLGKSGGQVAGGFESSAQTTVSMASQPILTEIRQRIEPFLTRAGVIAAQPGSLTSIVVTDTPATLEAIAQYLEGLNRGMTRHVRLVFEEMMVTRKEDHDQAIDWSMALATELAGLQIATSDAPPTAGSGATLGVSLPGLNGISGSLLLRTVSRFADVVRHTRVPVVTLNRRPVTHAVRSTFTYVDQVQSLAVPSKGNSAVALPGVAVTQKRETVGAFLTLVPDIQADGQVLLSVAYDNTVALPLKTLSFGGVASSVQLQQLNVQGNGTVQQVALRPGRPTLIAGFEHQQDESVQGRLTPDAPRLLGGHERVGHNRAITLIFVTAQVNEGV